jgi:hypothetical protein
MKIHIRHTFQPMVAACGLYVGGHATKARPVTDNPSDVTCARCQKSATYRARVMPSKSIGSGWTAYEMPLMIWSPGRIARCSCVYVMS